MNQEAIDRPEKASVFLLMAYVLSRLSHDSQTKQGCVITDKYNKIVGLGYNGFPRGMNDNKLPTTRPDKYPWMKHAERNAVSNSNQKLDHYNEGIAYVTGLCCFDCLTHLWQNHITEIYQLDRQSHMLDDKESSLKKQFLDDIGDRIKVHVVRPDFTFSLQVIEELALLGFIHREFDDFRDALKDITVC